MSNKCPVCDGWAPGHATGAGDICTCEPIYTGSPKTLWFTFGQSHRHVVKGTVFDKDTVIEITAPDPRAVMFALFGNKWSMQYDQPPDTRHFPTGIIKFKAP